MGYRLTKNNKRRKPTNLTKIQSMVIMDKKETKIPPNKKHRYRTKTAVFVTKKKQ